MSMQLNVVSPEGLVFQDTVDEVSLPTPEGEISILPHHVSLYSKMSDGIITVRKGAKESVVATVGGFLEVGDNIVTILTDHAIKAENIQIAKAQEAKKRAEDIMKKKESDVDFIIAEKELQKSILELKVADKLKRKQRF